MKAIVIKENGKVVYVGQEIEIKTHEYLELVKVCQKVELEKEKEKAELLDRIAHDEEEIKALEKSIEELTAKIKVIRGEIEQ